MLGHKAADSYFVTFMHAVRYMNGGTLSKEISRISEEMEYDPAIISSEEEIMELVKAKHDEYRFNADGENITAVLGQMKMIMERIEKRHRHEARQKQEQEALQALASNPNFGLF